MNRRMVVLAAMMVLGSIALAEDKGSSFFGWRGNGTGLFPDAHVPVEWSNVSTGPAEGLKCATAPPADGSDKNAVLVEAGLVTRWLVIGPFAIEDAAKDFTREMIPDEAKLAPCEGEKVGELSWKRAEPTSDGVSFQAVDALLGERGRPRQVGYAHTCLYARKAGGVRAVLEHVVGTKVYVNGKGVYSDNPLHGGERVVMGSAYGLSRHRVDNTYPVSPSFEFDLAQGWNRLTIKLASPNSAGWNDLKFYLRLMDLPSVPYERKNIVWMTPLPDRSNATPILVGDRLFVMAEPDELICIDKNTGKVLGNATHTLFDATPQAERDANPAFEERIEPLAAQIKTEKEPARRRELRQKLHEALLAVDKRKHALKLDGHYAGHFEIVGYTTTPCSDGQHVYVWTGAGVGACYDLDGQRQWIRRMAAKELFYPSSPAVIEGKLAVFMGHVDGDLYGLDAETGEIAWKQPKVKSNIAATLSTRIAGTSVFVSRVGDVIRASNGHMLWQNQETANRRDDGGWCPPLVLGDVLYIPRFGYSGVYVVDFAGCTGDAWKPKVEQIHDIYSGVGPTPLQMDRYSAGSPLVREGLMYGLDWYGIYYVIDLKAKRKLAHRDLGLRGEYTYVSMGVAASATLIGKHIVVMNNQGLALVLEPGSECRVVARNRLATQIPRDWPITTQEYTGCSPPVADGRRMYLRGERYLYCIGH